MAKEILRDILSDRQKAITIENIQKSVANHFNIKVSDLKSSKKLKIYSFPSPDFHVPLPHNDESFLS